ncbi:MAG: hypothetical protein CMM94_06375 [Rickettsiales bacterium]|nr:hypothetical protein [Rickettsiales bacterium]
MTPELLAENDSVSTGLKALNGHTSLAAHTCPHLSIALLDYISDKLPDIADYVERNAIDIVQQFKMLAEDTTNQSKNLGDFISAARTIYLDGEEVPFDKSVEVLYEPLAGAIDKILQVSKLAMSMVMTVSNAADNVERIEGFIEQVQKLTKQTNMLALNTQIEASRAGEAGRSFRVIASEVKVLSTEIKDLSEEMQMEIGKVSGLIKEASNTVENLANYDMTENLELKERVDELIESVMKQNSQYSELLEQSMSASDRTANSINGLVVGIQFQDRTSQMLGDLSALLQDIRGYMAQAAQDSPSTLDEGTLAAVLNEIKLSEVRHDVIEQLHAKGLVAESSPTWQEHNAHKSNFVSALSADAASTDDDDDIELF